MRYNVFYQVHKGLREMLYRTASQLQQVDFYNAVESEALIIQIKSVLSLFDKHADTEDRFVLTKIGQYEPTVSVLFQEEHVQDHFLSNRLEKLLDRLKLTTIDYQRIELGNVLRVEFVEFLTFNLKHMAKEEDVLNSLLWKHFTDEQLIGITQSILEQLPPDIMQQYSIWMMRGLSTVEIIEWMKEVKQGAPDFVFKGMLMIAENELSKNRWEIVKENIVEGAMIA